MSKNKKAGIAAMVLMASAALVLSGCGSDTKPSADADSTSPQSLKAVSMAGVGPTFVLQSAIERGAYKDYGLTVEMDTVANPPASLAALQGGQFDIAYAPLSTALTALSQGIDLKIVAPADGVPDDGKNAEKLDDTAIMINPDSGISSPKDLAGKQVAVPSRNGLSEIIAAGAVKAAGGDPSKINWLVLDQQSQVSSLVEGRIDAGVVVDPFKYKAEQQGMKVLVHPRTAFFEHGVSGVWVTTSATAASKAAALEAFQKADKEVNEWSNDHIETIAKMVIDQGNIDMDPSDFVAGYFTPVLKVTDVERANKKMVELGYLSSPVDLDGVFINGQ